VKHISHDQVNQEISQLYIIADTMKHPKDIHSSNNIQNSNKFKKN